MLAQPWADVVLSGAATVETLRSNLAAAEVEWTEDLDDRLAPLLEDAGRVLGAAVVAALELIPC